MNSDGKNLNGVGLRKNGSKELERVNIDNFLRSFVVKGGKEIGR